MSTVLLVAGDASGDLHAAGFVRALRARRPDTQFVGMAGEAAETAGLRLLAHQRELAVGGLFELAGGLRGVARAWRAMASALDELRPDLVVLVDSGGFNLPFARRVQRRNGVPVLYYVAPQVWAWRRGRIRKLAARVDRLAVIFPFEPEVYAGTSLPVDFVGHPLVESLTALAEQIDAKLARERLGLPAAGPLLALLPGSRSNEVARHLPLQLEAARRLHAALPDLAFALALAPSIARERVDAAIARASLPKTLLVEVVAGKAHETILAADAVLAKPGTATVEAALLARPMVVMGRAHPLTATLLRRLVRVPWYAMPNLIADREIVPELLQEQATPERIAAALHPLLVPGRVRAAQLEALAEVRTRLGAGGAADNAARIAGEMLEAR